MPPLTDNPGQQPPDRLSQPLGMIDIHSHLLPGVDDGCRDDAESIECAKRLVEAGFTHAFCTPHVQPDHPHNNVRRTPAAVARLQGVLDAAGVPLTLLPGGEIRLGTETISTPTDDLCLYNMGSSRGGRFLLFDTWERECPAYLEPTADWLLQRHITPILAHPERCPFVCEDPLDMAEYLAEIGVLLQLNCYVLVEPSKGSGAHVDADMRHCARRLLEFDHYSFLATDSHRANGMDCRLAGLEATREYVDEETFHRLTHRNPLELLPE